MTPWPSLLTVREVEVASLLARGYTCREIGEILDISIKTADTHRGKLLRKLRLRDAVALERYAIRGEFVSGAVEADAPGGAR